jgi:hypothetical protein
LEYRKAPQEKKLPKISELFDLQYGHSLELNRLSQTTGPNSVNFVGRAARNNGVTAKVALIPGLAPAESGSISVALGGQGGAGVAFLQPFPYYCGRDVMVLTAKLPMSDTEKLWWALCITANRFRFGFGRQANRTLKDLVLPDAATMPDWVIRADVSNYAGVEAPFSNEPLQPLDPAHWKSFRYDSIFKIRKGYYNRKPPASESGRAIPFIGATEYKNGITSYVSEEDLAAYSRDGSIKPDEPLERKLFPGECVTVSNNGSVGEAFYQPVPFTCSHDVNPLYLLDKGIRLAPRLGLFLATVIRADKYRWGYGRKWRPIRMPSSNISLPVTSAGLPDWAYMEQYVNALPYSAQVDHLAPGAGSQQ